MKTVAVIGGGPAGLRAALRAAELGARTIMVTSGELGGMAGTDGPVPVRALAHAARLMRDARQLGDYGVMVSEPVLDYSRLLSRVRDVVLDVQKHAIRRKDFEALGITVYENVRTTRFVGPNAIETQTGMRIEAESFIMCTGGVNRRLSVPGAEFTSSHSDVWKLTSVPESMLVVGSGATGAQVASLFNAFGTKMQLFEAGPRILSTEDASVSAEVATEFRRAGILVHEGFGTIESFEKTTIGVRMNFSKDGVRSSAEATLVVLAVGWVADAGGLGLDVVRVQLNERGFVAVDDYQQTSAATILAAGDVTGLQMLVPQALQQGYAAATNAISPATLKAGNEAGPVGSFTDPEYARVGLKEVEVSENEAIVATVRFDSITRSIIDGRKAGFCKLIVDRRTERLLGCHVVGERAVDITEIAAFAIASSMTLRELLRIPLAFPTYADILYRAAVKAADALKITHTPAS
jgi:pyruvate/2-oxoglutarate dehydrogenase complex dihydrolipoamide dehydrogenase (E3) component